MPVVIAAVAVLFTSWLTADGAPAEEPQTISENESLLTITETVESPLPPAPRTEEEVEPAPPPSTETEASPTTPDRKPDRDKPAKDECDKQVTFTPLEDPEQAAPEDEAEADAECAEEQPAKKKRKRHRRKSTDLRNSDGSPALTNPGFVDVLPGPSSVSGVPNFIIRKFRVPPFLL
ncbi:MAG: hypothetical protein JW895_13715, partial [Thermoleophilaceae bacterium]|nr:hypothetical protein [Thermoleophilaceae bacterium]